MTYTFIDLWHEAQREAALRRNVYERWVKDGRMTRIVADDGIAKMDAIAAHLEPMARAEIAAHEAEREAVEPRML